MGLIFLCGLPGSGKTTVGKYVSEGSGLPFIDLDSEIERESMLTIPEIFAQKGESFFRELESKALNDACIQENAVVALGAGASDKNANLELILNAGQLVYLRISPELVASRVLEWENRPLFRECSTREQFVRMLYGLLAKREANYSRSSVVINIVEHETPEHIAERLLSELK